MLTRLSLGLALGAVIAEGAFFLRDRGAFPHLNCYVADKDLAVRLEPLATERISFQGNPVSSIRIDEQGHRGGGWGAPSKNEVLVVGDSQVFGLGVEEDETFSAKLAEETHAPVRNAGVPTYGPSEYLAVLEETLRDRPMKTVIFTVNMANDLFEVSHPNVTRHVVWDGWAVRKETAPLTVTSFPGRELLFRRSHAGYALRGFLHSGDETSDPTSVPSEGNFRDVVTAADVETAAKSAAEKRRQATLDDHGAAVAKAEDAVKQAQLRLERVAWKEIPEIQNEDGAAEYRSTHGNPADVVRTREVVSEATRGPRSTIRELLKGADIRRRIEARMKYLAENASSPDANAAMKKAFEDRKAAQKALKELKGETPDAPPPKSFSPLAPSIARAKSLCDAKGAALLVLVLPLDVQVSSDEWAKYGQKPVDTSGTRILIDDVKQAALDVGAAFLDATPALTAAEPGAFLKGDLHMTPKGHAAVAHALATTLSTSPSH